MKVLFNFSPRCFEHKHYECIVGAIQKNQGHMDWRLLQGCVSNISRNRLQYNKMIGVKTYCKECYSTLINRWIFMKIHSKHICKDVSVVSKEKVDSAYF